MLITHGDNDHLHPPALSQIPTDTPVLIPSMGGAGEWQVDIRGILRALQFEDVRELQDWESASVGDATITAVPFEGEDWGLHQCSCTWLVEGLGRRIFLSADAAGMLPHAARIDGGRGVDLAFLGVSGNQEAHRMTPGHGYGAFYDPWVPDARAGRFVAHTDGPAQAAQLADALGARRAFGYAASGVPWMATAYSDEGDHAEFAARLEESSGSCVPVDLKPGQTYEVE